MEQMEQSGPGAGGQEFELVTEEEMVVEGGKGVGPGPGGDGGEPVAAEGPGPGAPTGEGLGEDLLEELGDQGELAVGGEGEAGVSEGLWESDERPMSAAVTER